MHVCFKGVDINKWCVYIYILFAYLTYTVSYLSLTKMIRMDFFSSNLHWLHSGHDGNTKNSK